MVNAADQDPIRIADLVDMLEESHHELALHIDDFNDVDKVVMQASYDYLDDLIAALVADGLQHSAQKVKKLTEAIGTQTKKINALKASLEQVAQIAGQVQQVLSAITPLLQYL